MTTALTATYSVFPLSAVEYFRAVGVPHESRDKKFSDSKVLGDKLLGANRTVGDP